MQKHEDGLINTIYDLLGQNERSSVDCFEDESGSDRI